MKDDLMWVDQFRPRRDGDWFNTGQIPIDGKIDGRELWVNAATGERELRDPYEREEYA
jgi:hypothetical protein